MKLTDQHKDLIKRLKTEGKTVVEIHAYLRGHQIPVSFMLIQQYYISLK